MVYGCKILWKQCRQEILVSWITAAETFSEPNIMSAYSEIDDDQENLIRLVLDENEKEYDAKLRLHLESGNQCCTDFIWGCIHVHLRISGSIKFKHDLRPWMDTARSVWWLQILMWSWGVAIAFQDWRRICVVLNRSPFDVSFSNRRSLTSVKMFVRVFAN